MLDLSIPLKDIRMVLFERIHEKALQKFEDAGVGCVQAHDFTPQQEDLRQLVADAHVIGIRSRTKLNKDVLDQAKNLLCVGCFCIGTNQVDLLTTKERVIFPR